jgi:hypothetical protein
MGCGGIQSSTSETGAAWMHHSTLKRTGAQKCGAQKWSFTVAMLTCVDIVNGSCQSPSSTWREWMMATPYSNVYCEWARSSFVKRRQTMLIAATALPPTPKPMVFMRLPGNEAIFVKVQWLIILVLR